jgi:hypothetical protein
MTLSFRLHVHHFNCFIIIIFKMDHLLYNFRILWGLCRDKSIVPTFIYIISRYLVLHQIDTLRELLRHRGEVFTGNACIIASRWVQDSQQQISLLCSSFILINLITFVYKYNSLNFLLCISLHLHFKVLSSNQIIIIIVETSLKYFSTCRERYRLHLSENQTHCVI